MQFQIEVNLNATPALLDAVNNLAAAIAAIAANGAIGRSAAPDKPAGRAARTPEAATPNSPSNRASAFIARTPKAATPEAAEPAEPAEGPGKSVPAAEGVSQPTPTPTTPESSAPAAAADQQVAEAPGKSAGAAEGAVPPDTATPAVGGVPTAKTISPSETGPTREQLRVALGTLAKTDRARALAILAEHGATSITTLPAEKYAAVLAAAK